MSRLKKVLSLIVAIMISATLIPSSTLANTTSVVYLTVANTTFPVSSGAAWEGKLLDSVAVEITDGVTKAMDVVVEGLEENNISQQGADMGYITDVNGLGEFGAGTGGGWMILLNDWFISAGADEIYVSDGDSISLLYTSVGFGEDLGGTWANNDKSIKEITFSEGTLSEDFSPEIYEYTLTVPSDTENIKVTPVAANKNFQTRTYLNTEVLYGERGAYIDGEEEYEGVLCGLEAWDTLPENIGFYKKTQSIPVEDGDVITVICGLSYWNSMNNGEFGTGAENENGCVYTFTIEKEIPVVETEEITVDVGVYDYTAVSYKEKNPDAQVSVSQSGTVYEEECIVEEGKSVLDALKEAFEYAQIEYSLDGNGTYFTMVNGLCELDCTSESGWMISVNDEFLTVSASEKILNDNDKVKLHYSTEGWGTDVGNYFTGGPVLRKITLGDIETIISSNTVYENENDWTGTTTYYLGQYVENGENTVIEGEGSIESPYIIPIKVSADADLTSLTATIETTLHENYLVISEGGTLKNILTQTNYENDVTFGIETLGGFYKTYYTVKVTKETAPEEEEDTYLPSPSPRPISKEEKEEEPEEEVKEETKEEIPPVSFEDTKGHWAEEYITRLATKNIIKGKDEASFSPDDRITRAEFVTLLYRLSGMKQKNMTEKFSDIEKDSWYAEAVSWAEENGIASGMTQSEFMPFEFINREQAAAFIIRFCEMMKYGFEEGEETEFKDADEFSQWSHQYIIKAQKCGIINGFEDGSFIPKGNTTRAQSAKMLCSMLDNIKE